MTIIIVDRRSICEEIRAGQKATASRNSRSEASTLVSNLPCDRGHACYSPSLVEAAARATPGRRRSGLGCTAFRIASSKCFEAMFTFVANEKGGVRAAMA